MRFFLTYTTMFSKLLGSSALICLVIMTTSFSSRDSSYPDPCSTIEVTVKISKNPGEAFLAKIESIGAKSPLRYIFYDNKGELITENFKNAEVAIPKAGKYTCIFREAGGCTKRIEFEVK
jgi:hypothetical protein